MTHHVPQDLPPELQVVADRIAQSGVVQVWCSICGCKLGETFAREDEYMDRVEYCPYYYPGGDCDPARLQSG